MSRFNILLINSLRAALITGIFAAFVICLPTERRGSKSGLSVSYASVQADIFNNVSIGGIQEIHGVKIMDYENHRIEYYFEYEANAKDTLKMVASLPFRIDDNVSSVAPVLMESNSNPLEVNAFFTKEALDATSFFWNANPEEYTFYECFKGSVKHTVLISKTSTKILHKIETV